VDALDPLLWNLSTHLLHGPGRAEAVEALESFLDFDAARLIQDPIRRAVFQRDLWAVFDWFSRASTDPHSEASHPEERRQLAHTQRLLARVIGQVALSDEEIRTLPDNHAQAAAAGRYPTDLGDLDGDDPVLPADLLDPTGDWVALEALGDPVFFNESIVPLHAEHFQGRSVFSVHLKLPGGRAETVEYLERLSSFEVPRVAPPADYDLPPEETSLSRPFLLLNPETPQLPVGSAVALVRRMLLVDRGGRLVVSPLVESVQIRWFRSFGEPPRLGRYFDVGMDSASLRAQQRVVEFELDRRNLFAGDAGGLRAIGADETSLATFLTHGSDPFEHPEAVLERSRTRRLDRCFQCHGAPGIFSLQSYTRIHSGPGTQFGAQALLPTARFRPARLADLEAAAVLLKSRRYEWGLLQALLGSTTAPDRGG